MSYRNAERRNAIAKCASRICAIVNCFARCAKAQIGLRFIAVARAVVSVYRNGRLMFCDFAAMREREVFLQFAARWRKGANCTTAKAQLTFFCQETFNCKMV